MGFPIMPLNNALFSRYFTKNFLEHIVPSLFHIIFNIFQNTSVCLMSNGLLLNQLYLSGVNNLLHFLGHIDFQN